MKIPCANNSYNPKCYYPSRVWLNSTSILPWCFQIISLSSRHYCSPTVSPFFFTFLINFRSFSWQILSVYSQRISQRFYVGTSALLKQKNIWHELLGSNRTRVGHYSHRLNTIYFKKEWCPNLAVIGRLRKCLNLVSMLIYRMKHLPSYTNNTGWVINACCCFLERRTHLDMSEVVYKELLYW